MAIELRVPTILRTFTGGEKLVTGAGETLAAFIDNVDGSHPGIKERIVEGEPEELRRFVNVYVNDEDVRFTGGLATGVKDGDVVVVLPAVAGG
ncbi:MoaD/ThiS family protein [Kribbella sp. NPDC056951]|uniref:MoaD/ThiS family protein n=1 Tax=Kribbella yunnanensis TaxID=190194 RepID=A0ABP4TFT2_9ACTN